MTTHKIRWNEILTYEGEMTITQDTVTLNPYADLTAELIDFIHRRFQVSTEEAAEMLKSGGAENYIRMALRYPGVLDALRERERDRGNGDSISGLE